MSGGCVSPPEKSRILRSAVVRSVDADRNAVVGRLLDQQEFRSGASVARSHDRADDDDDIGHVKRYQRVISEGARCLVLRLSVPGLQRSARVRLRQRLRTQREEDFRAAD